MWALGVILVNMITCRSPWLRAVTRDDGFHNYVVDEDYLLDLLPISKSANHILKRIFQLEQFGRIAIRDLKDLILEADTFFMTPEEVAKAPRAVRETWSGLKARQKKVLQARLKDARKGGKKPPAAPPAGIPKAPRKAAPSVPRGPGSLSGAGSSESESAGPLTPAETGVAKPRKEAPVPSQEQDLGDAALLGGPPHAKITFKVQPLRVINDSEAGLAVAC